MQGYATGSGVAAAKIPSKDFNRLYALFKQREENLKILQIQYSLALQKEQDQLGDVGISMGQLMTLVAQREQKRQFKENDIVSKYQGKETKDLDFKK